MMQAIREFAFLFAVQVQPADSSGDGRPMFRPGQIFFDGPNILTGRSDPKRLEWVVRKKRGHCVISMMKRLAGPAPFTRMTATP